MASNRKHFYNEHYFDNIDNEEKAYWLGFFYADGCVYNNSFTCTLQHGDSHHLQKFLDAVGADDVELYTIHKDRKNIGKGFTLCSGYLTNSLKGIGFQERKTYVGTDEIFYNVPDELKRHFIRGYWDGNGNISLRNKGRFSIMGVVCLNYKLLNAFCKYFNNYFNDPNFSKVFQDCRGYYRVVITGERANQVCHLFYDNATVFLDRKFQKYLKYKTYDRNYQGIRKRKSGKYQAYIKRNYVQHSLGTYATIKDALDAYNKDAIEHNMPTQEYYGESLMRKADRIV